MTTYYQPTQDELADFNDILSAAPPGELTQELIADLAGKFWRSSMRAAGKGMKVNHPAVNGGEWFTIPAPAAESPQPQAEAEPPKPPGPLAGLPQHERDRLNHKAAQLADHPYTRMAPIGRDSHRLAPHGGYHGVVTDGRGNILAGGPEDLSAEDAQAAQDALAAVPQYGQQGWEKGKQQAVAVLAGARHWAPISPENAARLRQAEAELQATPGRSSPRRSASGKPPVGRSRRSASWARSPRSTATRSPRTGGPTDMGLWRYEHLIPARQSMSSVQAHGAVTVLPDGQIREGRNTYDTFDDGTTAFIVAHTDTVDGVLASYLAAKGLMGRLTRVPEPDPAAYCPDDGTRDCQALVAAQQHVGDQMRSDPSTAHRGLVPGEVGAAGRVTHQRAQHVVIVCEEQGLDWRRGAVVRVGYAALPYREVWPSEPYPDPQIPRQDPPIAGSGRPRWRPTAGRETSTTRSWTTPRRFGGYRTRSR